MPTSPCPPPPNAAADEWLLLELPEPTGYGDDLLLLLLKPAPAAWPEGAAGRIRIEDDGLVLVVGATAFPLRCENPKARAALAARRGRVVPGCDCRESGGSRSFVFTVG